MDIIDQAAERELMDRSLALAAQAKHEPALIPIGLFYNCEASVPTGADFCDCDCRNDYEKRKRAESLR